jgi:hypothetical protein
MQTAHGAIAPLPNGSRRAVQWLVVELVGDLTNCDLRSPTNHLPPDRPELPAS